MIGFLRDIKKVIVKRNRDLWVTRLKKNLKNTDFTIISSNCIGGVIYHDLGLKFDSPTINLYFKNNTDFPKFCRHIVEYTNCELIDVSNEENFPFPCGRLLPQELPPIDICFQHYDTFFDAHSAWMRRCQRIHMDNIFFIYEFYNDKHSVNTLIEFDKLPYKNKVALTHEFVENISCQKIVNCYKKGNQVGKILAYKGISGKRHLDEFDYISFLNKEK